MLNELFMVVMLVMFVLISIPVLLLDVLIIIAHMIEDKEQKDEYNRLSQQNNDGGGEV